MDWYTAWYGYGLVSERETGVGRGSCVTMPRDPISGGDLHPDHMDRWPDDVKEALEAPGDPRSVTGSSGQGGSE